MKEDNTQEDLITANYLLNKYFADNQSQQETVDTSNVFIGLEEVVSEINEMFKQS